MDLLDKHIEISPENFREAIQSQRDFYIQFAVYDKEAEFTMLKMIRSFLSRHDILYLRDVTITIVKELVTNAVKANAKRIYFENKNLSLINPDEYKKGMKTFKKEVLQGDSNIFMQMIKSHLRVRVIFISDNGAMWIKVINNTGIAPIELEKVRARIGSGKSYEYKDITSAFETHIDDSEGAGLGLVMALMIFKNAGFSPEDFKITSDGEQTVSSVAIYERPNRHYMESRIAEEIIKEIEALPSFPDHINKIKFMCDDPDSSVNQIASAIKKDVALASSILRLANSALFLATRQTESIENAVKVIGINGIKMLLIASGIQKIIDSNFKKYKEIWFDSPRRAFYAHRIAMQLNNHSIAENAYIGALLCEIGRAILLSVKKGAINSLGRLSGLKATGTIDMIEEMALGVSHATLGGLIAKKWQFSEQLCKTIEFYTRPYMAPEEYRDIVFTVHLAHAFIEIERKKYHFEIVDDEVLDYFHLYHKETFDKLHTVLKQAYSQKSAL